MGGSLSSMLTCKEVSHSIATDEVQTAGWRQRLAVKLHLLMCRHCSRLIRQIQMIRKAGRELRVRADLPDSPSQETTLESRLLEKLRDPNGR